MKRYFTSNINVFTGLAFIFLFQTSLLSQVTKGTTRLGPNLSYSSTTEEYEVLDSEYNSTSTNFVVSAGYFLIDNLELGLGIQLLNSSSEVDDDEFTSTGRAIGPTLTYMIPLNKNAYLPLFAGIAYNSTKISDNIDDYTVKGWSYGLGAGIEYIVSNQLGARISLGYAFGTLKENEIDLESDVSKLQIGVGVNFYFNKKWI